VHEVYRRERVESMSEPSFRNRCDKCDRSVWFCFCDIEEEEE